MRGSLSYSTVKDKTIKDDEELDLDLSSSFMTTEKEKQSGMTMDRDPNLSSFFTSQGEKKETMTSLPAHCRLLQVREKN
jgi:hypothetical protein